MHQTTLCEAIEKRQIVRLRYDDDYIDRTFAPYIVYWSSKRNMLVSGYQIENPAEPLERNEWRNLDIDKIRTLSITNNAFRPDSGFDPFHKRYSAGIICHVFQHGR